jgi:tetratricopeptide (TPR) repeat protein
MLKERKLPRLVARAGVAIVLVIVCWAGAEAAGGQSERSPAVGPGSAAPKQSEAPAEAGTLVQQGDGRLAQKNFAAAEAAFRRALAADPTLAEAHRGLGFALWEQGHPDAAWKELVLAARLEPDSATAHYALGKLAWFLYQHPGSQNGAAQTFTPNDFQALALNEVEKAVALDPRDFKMRLDLAEMDLAVGRDKQAQTEAEQAVPLAPSPVERSSAEVTMAQALASTGDEDRAEAECQKALQENPANGDAYLSLGQIRLAQRMPLEAEGYFRRALQVSPGLEPAYAALAELLAGAGEHAQAKTLLEKAVALDPQDWHSQYQLALLLMEGGESARAKDMLSRIVSQQEDFLPAREQLALLLLRQGDVDGALEQAQSLLARNPQAVEGHWVMALVMWRKRDMESSLAECAMALTVNPHSAAMLALQAIELWQQKRKRDAQRAFREAVQRDPSVASAANFCRLIACDSQDIPLVDEFLHKNRWVLNPPGAE